MNKMKVLLISAKSGHGKDYCAGIIKDELERKGKKVLITHYADLLKYICKSYFDWNGEKDETGRNMLQTVGTQVRNTNPDYWVNFIEGLLKIFHSTWDYILIPDTRYVNEVTNIRNDKLWDTYSIRVNRPGYISNLTLSQRMHESETALDSYDKFDFYIQNDDTTKDQIIRMIDNIENPHKKNIYIDFDGTIYNTIKAIVTLYDRDFYYYSDYKKINWKDIKTWDFRELSATTPEYIDHYFNQSRFFNVIKPFENAYKIIYKLSSNYNIKIVSHGYSPNLRAKADFIEDELPFAEFIGVNLKQHNDKSSIDMSDGIFIDDKALNLETSNAAIKICYGDEYEWNKDFNVDENNYRCFTWEDIYSVICKLNKIKVRGEKE